MHTTLLILLSVSVFLLPDVLPQLTLVKHYTRAVLELQEQETARSLSANLARMPLPMHSDRSSLP